MCRTNIVLEVSMSIPTEPPGVRLKRLRLRLRLTTREVAQMSDRIASTVGRDDMAISHARLVQIENGVSTPGIYKLFALSAIYGTSITVLLSYYFDLDESSRLHLDLPVHTTRLIDADLHAPERAIELPLAFKHDVSLDATNFIGELAEVWGHVPVAWLKQLNIRRGRYAIIGLSDYTMYPLLRPGSFVQIEETAGGRELASYATELDRPIFFIEIRDGYLCSWCEIKGNRLICIPHPLSRCRIREFAYPHEARIIGRVVAVAARIVAHGSSTREEHQPESSTKTAPIT
jgi:transcriptional regulator with XRE-family HTH domain